MNDLFLVYTTDVNHSHSSKELIGAATTFPQAIKICRAFAARENEIIDDFQLSLLKSIKQTQGYEGTGCGEFIIDSVTKNKLL